MKKTSGGDLDPRLARVYARLGDKRDLWDEWADHYDDDLLGDLGYAAHEEAGEALLALVPDRDAQILDAGCGTGLAGAWLAAHGYRNLHGVDYSEPMLAQARARGTYRSLARHDLTRPLAAPARYEAIVCVGVFAFFPPHVRDLRYLVAGARPGAPVLVTVNGKGWRERDWERLLDEEERAGVLHVERCETIRYLQAQGIDGRLLVLRDAGSRGG